MDGTTAQMLDRPTANSARFNAGMNGYMAAGVTDALMDMSHLARLMGQAEEAPKSAGPYKKQAA
jgi:hypothetical protein